MDNLTITIILYSSQWEIKAVVRSHNKVHLSIILIMNHMHIHILRPQSFSQSAYANSKPKITWNKAILFIQVTHAITHRSVSVCVDSSYTAGEKTAHTQSRCMVCTLCALACGLVDWTAQKMPLDNVRTGTCAPACGATRAL